MTPATTVRDRLLAIIEDNRWHSIRELERAIGGRQANTLHRAFNAIKLTYGHWHEKKLIENPGGEDYYVYRIIRNAVVQRSAAGPAETMMAIPEEPTRRYCCPESDCHRDRFFATPDRSGGNVVCECGRRYGREDALVIDFGAQTRI